MVATERGRRKAGARRAMRTMRSLYNSSTGPAYRANLPGRKAVDAGWYRGAGVGAR